MNLIEVQGHEHCVLVSVVAGPASRFPEAERLVERNSLRVGGAHLEVDTAGVGKGGERGADQGAGVSTPAVLRSYGDGGYVQLAEDVLAVLDARRGQVFARRYSEAGPTTGIYCLRPEELSVEGGPFVVGDGAVRYRGDLSGLGRIPPDGSPLHTVTAVGHVMSADLTLVSPDELIPIYVREPDAEVRRDLNPWSRS